MDDLQRYFIERACERVVLDAAAFADTNEAQKLADLFADHGTLVRPGGKPLRGRMAIHDAYASRSPDRITRHLISNVRVDVLSEITASSICYVQVWSGSMIDDAGPLGRPCSKPLAVGEFIDRFQKFGEDWRITSREAKFILSTPS